MNPSNIPSGIENEPNASDAFVLPKFDCNYPKDWFWMAEQIFTREGTKDQDKYCHLFKALITPIHRLVNDIPPTYDLVKKALIERLNLNVEELINVMLMNVQQENMQPSAYYHHMNDIAGNHKDPSGKLIYRIWFERLHDDIKLRVKPFESKNIDEILQAADKAAKILKKAIPLLEEPDARPSSSYQRLDDASIENKKRQKENVHMKIEEPNHKDDELMLVKLKRRRRSSSYSSAEKSRSRSPSCFSSAKGRSPHRQAKLRKNNGMQCYFHHRYGNKARRCEPWCPRYDEFNRNKRR